MQAFNAIVEAIAFEAATHDVKNCSNGHFVCCDDIQLELECCFETGDMDDERLEIEPPGACCRCFCLLHGDEPCREEGDGSAEATC